MAAAATSSSEPGGGGGRASFQLLSPASALRSAQFLAAEALSRVSAHNLRPRPLAASASPPATAAACSAAMAAPVALPVLSFYLDGMSPASTQASSSIMEVSPGMRVDGLRASSSKVGGAGGGPAFVGQVFSMLDPSGNGLMAVTTHKREPDWFKKLLSNITKCNRSGPVFRFFMDLSDAVNYVKQLKIPSGMVGACRLDVAYEHFKEKPHMFQFVPNEKQVKAARKLLRMLPRGNGKRTFDGVPVFSAQNLNIAIATTDGIKWYTPYFFDKNLLDNILEASTDQHFHTLIQNRQVQRRRDAMDDSFSAEMAEENLESLFEPPEVQDLLAEMGQTGIPLSVLSKAAEIQVLDVVDNVLLGNKWLRRATGIQPKFPYVVDSFEKRTAASLSKALGSADNNGWPEQQQRGPSESSGSREPSQGCHVSNRSQSGFHFAFGKWFSNLLSWTTPKDRNLDSDIWKTRTQDYNIDKTPAPVLLNPLLPNITMVGVSMFDGGQANRASLRKAMEDLTRELEASQRSTPPNEEKDPLFVANVGDYSIMTRTNPS